MTPEEFAKSIKSKYPQYAQIPDAELTQKMLAKYPQYRSQVTSTVSAAPPKWSLQDLEGRAMTMRDWIINKLPTIGGTVGGIIGGASGAETGPGLVATGALGAAAGAGLGEDARQTLTEHLHPEDKKMTPTESLVGMGKQALEQGGAELIGGAVASKLAPTFEKTLNNLFFAGDLGPSAAKFGEPSDLHLVMPEILLQEKETPAKTVGGFLNVLSKSKQKIADEVNTAMLYKVAGPKGTQIPLGAAEADVTPIADNIRNLIRDNPQWEKYNPEKVSAIKKRIDTFYSKPETFKILDRRRMDLGKELNRFYALGKDKTGAAQALYLAQHPEFEIDKAEADAIRDVIYPAMDKAAGKPAGYFENLQRKRGALMSIEDQTMEHAKDLENRMRKARAAPWRDTGHAYVSERGKIGLYTRLTHLGPPDVMKEADKRVGRAFGRTVGSRAAKAASSPVGKEVLVLPLRLLANPAMPLTPEDTAKQ